jgi:arginyl-tRNA synthetase
MNLFKHFKVELVQRIQALQADGRLPPDLDLDPVTVEPPRDPAHGDLATNAAMVLARACSMNPRQLADLLAPVLRAIPGVVGVNIAGPGFINLRLAETVWQQLLALVLIDLKGFGSSDLGAGRPLNVEYVSANPTGPMHVGHCRGAVFGDALATLLTRAGYKVCREYYINDAGAQIDVVARSVFLRYREALGEDIGEIPEGLYPGDYLKPVGAELARIHGDALTKLPEEGWLPLLRDAAIDAMMAMIREDLAALGIRHDVFSSEQALHRAGKVDAALAELEARGQIYVGVLEPPKGKLPEDWEERPQTLFKATAFGDDVDRPLKKADGSWTYFASDIAYHKDKFDRGFAEQIDVWGADHAGYIKRMQASLRAITGDKATLDVKICQLVRLMRRGEPVKMSKRSGDFVTLREVVDEVGPDVVRFMMLFRKNDASLDFDFAKVTEQSKENPVFYVQYAHARIHSVLKNATEALGEVDLSDQALARAKLTLLGDDAELGLIKALAQYPRQIESAAEAHEPHRIAFYIHDLASTFHSLWNRGKDDHRLRFIQPENPDATLARLALIRACQAVIADGLAILGVTQIEEMR